MTIKSPEFTFLIVIAAVSAFGAQWIFITPGKWLARHLQSNELFALATILGLCGTAWKVAMGVLQPNVDKKALHILLNWETYPLLKDQVYLTLAYFAVGIAACLSCVVLFEKLPPHQLGALFLSGSGLALVSLACLFLAQVDIRETILAAADED